MTDLDSVPCPVCPMCGQPPLYVHPAIATGICQTEGCPVFAWDMYSTKEANLADAGQVRYFRDGVEVFEDPFTD